jgi:hypothetical protein
MMCRALGWPFGAIAVFKTDRMLGGVQGFSKSHGPIAVGKLLIRVPESGLERFFCLTTLFL